MSLSLADKLALIYTSAGSLRKTAALAGMSHQQVGRILHKAMLGESTAYYERKLEITEGVEVAFEIHKDLARGVARRHGLPFDGSIPVYAERLELKIANLEADGKVIARGTRDELYQYIRENDPPGKLVIKRQLGDRVGAFHLHWLSDQLRDKWVTSSQKSGKYYQASAGSLVNLPKYMKAAEQRIRSFMNRGGIKTEQMIRAKEQLRNLVKDHVDIQRVFTTYTSMDPEFPSSLVLNDINSKLQDRHAPAVGEQGTSLADQMLLQLDTRKISHAKQSRFAKHGKTRGNKARNRGSVRSK